MGQSRAPRNKPTPLRSVNVQQQSVRTAERTADRSLTACPRSITARSPTVASSLAPKSAQGPRPYSAASATRCPDPLPPPLPLYLTPSEAPWTHPTPLGASDPPAGCQPGWCRGWPSDLRLLPRTSWCNLATPCESRDHSARAGLHTVGAFRADLWDRGPRLGGGAQRTQRGPCTHP